MSLEFNGGRKASASGVLVALAISPPLGSVGSASNGLLFDVRSPIARDYGNVQLYLHAPSAQRFGG